MQVINVRVENEKGEVLRTSPVNFADILIHVWEVPEYKSELQFLAGIDPYGHTLFNVQQVPYLLRDLGKLYNLSSDENVKVLMVKVNQFLNEVEQHDYVRFIGD